MNILYRILCETSYIIEKPLKCKTMNVMKEQISIPTVRRNPNIFLEMSNLS